MIKAVVVFWETYVDASFDDRLIVNVSAVSVLALFDDKLTVALI